MLCFRCIKALCFRCSKGVYFGVVKRWCVSGVVKQCCVSGSEPGESGRHACGAGGEGAEQPEPLDLPEGGPGQHAGHQEGSEPLGPPPPRPFHWKVPPPWPGLTPCDVMLRFNRKPLCGTFMSQKIKCVYKIYLSFFI